MQNFQEHNTSLLQSLLATYASGAQRAAAETSVHARRLADEGYDAEAVTWWQYAAARQSEGARMWMDRLLEQDR